LGELPLGDFKEGAVVVAERLGGHGFEFSAQFLVEVLELVELLLGGALFAEDALFGGGDVGVELRAFAVEAFAVGLEGFGVGADAGDFCVFAAEAFFIGRQGGLGAR